MKFIKTICAVGAVTAAMSAGNAVAKVSADQAARLGQDLTLIGAEMAGNADGTIPAYTGGLKDIPAGYVSGKPYINPYADEKPLFTISKDNMAQYADKLIAGQKKMLEKYPTYTMPVYKTHRTAVITDEIAGYAKTNVLNTEVVDGGNGLQNFEGIMPFPIPNNGLEIIWNHITRFRGGSLERFGVQVTPTETGRYSPVRIHDEFARRIKLKDFAKNKDDNVLFYYKQVITSPARLAGNVLLVHETLDQVKEARRGWIYNAGQRRVRRAPQVSYDGPSAAADGLKTVDNFDMFNGAPDRYDWNLIGKKELYIPYNSYDLDDKKYSYDDLVKPGHLNSEPTRYELHRVWVVEATLKAGARHIYSKRLFYVDEDTWAIVLSDMYDGRGEHWRFHEAHNKLHYDIGAQFQTVDAVYDLPSGRYVAQGLANEEPLRYNFKKAFKTKDFTPAALRRSGKR